MPQRTCLPRLVVATVVVIGFASCARADIFQWEYINPADPSQGKRQSTTLAPGGAGVDAVHGANLRDCNLTMAYLIDANVESANFLGATLTDADFTGAKVRGANFDIYTYGGGTGITPAQLYSTASYQARDLTGISLHRNNLAGANFVGQNLTNAYLYRATLTDADFSGAEVRGAIFGYDDYGGTNITLAQLYSTASYQAHDLTGIRFWSNNLSGGNFAGQNLTNAIFDSATLTAADFTGAEVRGASFYGRYDSNASMYVGGITLGQLYSTASYQAHDLTAIGLGGNDLSGGNFAGQNLANADLGNATLAGADFTGAVVRGAKFYKQANLGTGIALAQLYSTASYQTHDLTGIDLQLNNLDGANFAGQNLTDVAFSGATLTNADFSGANLTNAYLAATLTGANFTGAEVRRASFDRSPGYTTGITLAQLYSTASYQAHDLRGINLPGNNLAGGSLAGQNLSDANLGGATLTEADFSGANLTDAYFVGATLTYADFTDAEIRGAEFGGTGITLAQLYSTASYQAHDLSGIGLTRHDLAGANFARQNLENANFGAATLTNANFREANLANTNFVVFHFCLLCPIPLFLPGNFEYAILTNADLTAADARGTAGLGLANVTTANLIRPDGHIDCLDLDAGGLLVVRDYDGNPTPSILGFPFLPSPSPIPPIAITVDQHLAMSADGTLRMVFEADAWDSTISFAPGIPVTLGGTLELTFAADVNLASQVGRTFDLFDWTGVTPTGAFAISSPYAWDFSNLYTTGEATLTAVPEPQALLLFSLTLSALVAMCRVRIPI